MPAYSRIIVKVGTNTLTGPDDTLDLDYVARLVAQLCKAAETAELALVTSGAIRIGLTTLGLEKSRSLRESQAAAAVGQGLLMHHYQQLFQRHDRLVAQVLLTNDAMHNRNRYLNARNTLLTLFEKRVIPIINENDTIATDEIKFGDNDNLAAQVAAMVGADLLIFLSDVEGFYADHATRQVLPVIEQITPAVEAAARGPVSSSSKGGMTTKIAGAKIATHSGCNVHIAHGRCDDVILKVVSDTPIGTRFLAHRPNKERRKLWIGFSGKVSGALTIDAGAVEALLRKQTSLLPAGVTDVNGDFKTGDVVRVVDEKGVEIGRGLTNYSASEISRIKGMHSQRLEQILGYRGDPEIIQRDNLLVYHSENSAREG
jgi:glutamate 5-kinase